MTDEITREEFETLRDRIAELEEQLSRKQESSNDGLDHRDRNVLEFMRENGKRSKLKLVRLYKSQTDISSTNTAKERARSLERHPAYKSL